MKQSFSLVRSTLMLGFASLLLLSPRLAVVSFGQRASAKTKAVSRSQTMDVQSRLTLADFYYRNDDITDRAAAEYRKVRDSFPQSRQAEKAQYFLGSYYHRKFYIEKEKRLKEDPGALVEAQGQYEDYIDKYAWSNKSPDWLSDAYFNLALISLQRGNSQQAEVYLGKMYGSAAYDPTVYVYQVIWSPSSRTVVDTTVDARRLSQYANSLVYGLRQQRISSFGEVVDRLQGWCSSQGATSKRS